MSQVPIWTLWLIPSGTLLAGLLTAGAAYLGVRYSARTATEREERLWRRQAEEARIARLYSDRLTSWADALAVISDVLGFGYTAVHEAEDDEGPDREKLRETTHEMMLRLHSFTPLWSRLDLLGAPEATRADLEAASRQMGGLWSEIMRYRIGVETASAQSIRAKLDKLNDLQRKLQVAGREALGVEPIPG